MTEDLHYTDEPEPGFLRTQPSELDNMATRISLDW